LDFANLAQALRVAHEAWAGGVRRLEAGTPLIKSEGLDVVRQLRAEFPDATIVADMKVMDAGRAEVEMAVKAGANVVTVLGAASDATIAECLEAAQRYGAQIMVDLIEVPNLAERAQQAQELGADLVGVHCPIDVQMQGGDPMAALREVAAAVTIPIAVAGGLNSETAPEAITAGASIAIVGGAIIKAADAQGAARAILSAIALRKPVISELFKRGGPDQIREMFMRATCANISDAMHHKGWVPGLRSLTRGVKCAGPALTVWAYPGDWSKPVEAIDQAEPGTVLVIDVRGEGPAVWGEGATKSCVSRRLAGVVIHGCARDTKEIIELGFPVFCSMVGPQAGDPRGVGMIGVPLRIGETPIRTGDWIIADDDGVICVPQEHAVEIANRAMDVVEREIRDHAEIDEKGLTLAHIAELERWEQQRGKE
ncbi:MAG: orotidine 5'-phosphate decarboxylase, partial [Armatimonadetes bacterium]|nr:orotidine 5'-phosphate decarboxylase [Armatimonadota bacterium]